ncbi:MAG: 50S ribosomal protein L18 [Patescibacteria group bacterium]
MKKKTIVQIRDRRKARIRAKIRGTNERPRLTIFRSNRYLHAQIINDDARVTLASGSTRGMKSPKKKAEQAEKLGGDLAKKAQEKGVKALVLDKGAYKYHGRVKSLADGVRKAGITI